MPEVEEVEKKKKPEEKAEKAEKIEKPEAEKPKEKKAKPEEEKLKEAKPEGKAKEEEDKDEEKKAEEKPKRKGGFKFKFKLSIPPVVKYVVISLVTLAFLAIGAYFLASKAIKPFMQAQIGKSTVKKEKAVAKKKAEGAKVTEVFLVRDMIINPAETQGTRFLNVTIGLGVGDVEANQVLEEKSPQIRDAMISVLTTKTIPELVHPNGKMILRKEITKKVNRIIAPHEILEVYFVDFVLQ